MNFRDGSLHHVDNFREGQRFGIPASVSFRHVSDVAGTDYHGVKQFSHAQGFGIEGTARVAQRIHHTLVGAPDLLQS